LVLLILIISQNRQLSRCAASFPYREKAASVCAAIAEQRQALGKKALHTGTEGLTAALRIIEPPPLYTY